MYYQELAVLITFVIIAFMVYGGIIEWLEHKKFERLHDLFLEELIATHHREVLKEIKEKNEK